MSATALDEPNRPLRMLLGIGIFVAAIAVITILVWQGIFAHGAPDPTQPNTSATVASLDIGVLVFREGLECILVLAAITASMTALGWVPEGRMVRRSGARPGDLLMVSGSIGDATLGLAMAQSGATGTRPDLVEGMSRASAGEPDGAGS